MQMITPILICCAILALVAVLGLIARRRVNELQQEKAGLAAEKKAAETALADTKADLKVAQQLLQSQTEQTEKARLEREQQYQQQLDLLKEQMENASQKMLKERAADLNDSNRKSMDELFSSVRQQMQQVDQLMKETQASGAKSTSELQGRIAEMLHQTQQISADANNLANALKNRGKVHGDWGEHVLEDILSGSGLREGIEFRRQDNHKGEDGNDLRPDVVVNCPDDKCIIVDSKVSLTAYADAIGAETDDERVAAEKKNFDSVKAHVDELAKKNYPRYVEGALNYVLMFVPNEGAYVMAMNHDTSLGQYAFQKGVVIVNPTNLMLVLNLILQTWQGTRQEDNCKRIINAANLMYEKVIGIVDTLNTMDGQLATVSRTWANVRKQVVDGQGNLLSKVDNLRQLGVTSTKRPKKAVKSQTAESLPEPEETYEAIEVPSIEADSAAQ